MTYASVLTALSDPTRRRIVERLAAGPQRLGSLARGLPVSRPAVSQHVRLLCDAGLVRATGDGPRKDYALDPEALTSLRLWLDSLWTVSLAAYGAAAQKEADRP
jgi:DNA-binding transcriptional ArsR family regulator